jgi:hypothetical protein
VLWIGSTRAHSASVSQGRFGLAMLSRFRLEWQALRCALFPHQQAGSNPHERKVAFSWKCPCGPSSRPGHAALGTAGNSELDRATGFEIATDNEEHSIGGARPNKLRRVGKAWGGHCR